MGNGVLVCPVHHTMLHTSGYRMKMVDGRPYLLAPHWIDPDQVWIAVGKSKLEVLRRLRKAG